MKDYSNKIVYLGIDVHKKTYAVTAICEQQVVKRDTLTADPEQLVNYIKKYFDGAQVHSVYEAGFSGFYLHRYLKDHEVHNIVVHPSSIKVSSRDRVKTDKRDSYKMAKQLSNGDLKGISVPSVKRENYRTLTRIRDQLVETRKQAGNRLKSLLHLHGLITPENDTKVGKVWLKKLAQLKLAEELKFGIKTFIDLWLYLDDQMQKITKKLHEQSEADKSLDMVYRATPGIGALSARILSNELESMKQFHSEKALFSYTGLTPSEHSSGEHRWQGNISRQGKPILRKILVQVAWRAIKQDKRLAEYFERISKRAGRKKAIVAVARKMIGCIRSCFINGEIWCTNAPGSKESLSNVAEAC